MGNLADLLNKYKLFIIEKGQLENEDFDEICNIAIKSIENTLVQKENLRVVDLNSVIYYFSEVIKNSLEAIKKALSKYFSRRRLKTLTTVFINKIKKCNKGWI